MTIIPAPQEGEIRRIEVQGHPWQDPITTNKLSMVIHTVIFTTWKL
jgi:hypothetical protein